MILLRSYLDGYELDAPLSERNEWVSAEDLDGRVEELRNDPEVLAFETFTVAMKPVVGVERPDRSLSEVCHV